MGMIVLARSSRIASFRSSNSTTGAGVVALLLALLASSAPASGKSRITFPYSPCTAKSKLAACVAKHLSTELSPYTPKSYPDHGLADTMTEQGRHARGFYITPMYLRALGVTLLVICFESWDWFV